MLKLADESTRLFNSDPKHPHPEKFLKLQHLVQVNYIYYLVDEGEASTTTDRETLKKVEINGRNRVNETFNEHKNLDRRLAKYNHLEAKLEF